MDEAIVLMQNEARQIWSGHWRPAGVCLAGCPMCDPKSAPVFRRVLDRAICGGK